MPGLVSSSRVPLNQEPNHGQQSLFIMHKDWSFPNQLYPHFYLDGPPEVKPKHSYGGWGSYERVLAVNAGPCNGEESIDDPKFESQHTQQGEQWVQLKASVTPLMPACLGAKVLSSELVDPLGFPEQMQYYYQHYCLDAFPTMGHLLQESFTFKHKKSKDVISVPWALNVIHGLRFKSCGLVNVSRKVRHMHHLLSDLVSDVPPSLLASLLSEELSSHRERQQFCPGTSGGALGYMPFLESQMGGTGCLIYPTGAAMDKLCFHRVAQEFQEDKAPTFAAVSIPFIFDLNGAVKQISLGRMEDVGKVAVRSDYFCGVWVLGDATKPRFLDVIRSKDRFTSINVSPHIPNELVVTNERGSAYLWTVQKGLQKFREEESNLYFNAKSSWRWCDFSCHPRVVVYVDRTGAELTDIRAHDCKHTLFRIGRTPACVSGERVILHKYLGNLHSHQHLINTQFSTYIMDERVPSVPMLKWNHMMESPPSFACALPARTQSQPCKVLLGSQRSQEIMLLQYRGGREQACQTQGAIQKLLSPKESLSYLHSELPHRNHLAQKRLHVPAAGFTALQNEDYLSVFQLVETGDIFFQTLKLHNDQITDNGDVQEQDVSVERPSCENLNLDTNSIDSGTKERSATLRRLEVIDNVCSEQDLDINAQICDEPPGKRPSCSNGLVEQSRDSELQNVWETWFKPLFEEAAKKKRSTHFRPVQIGALKNLKKKKQDKLEKDTLTRLRKDLKEAMVKKDLILHGNTYMPHLEIIPLPHPVDPDEWPDDVSQRLAASWEGNWKNWWEDKLGLNKNDKIAALRRKRQREKQAKARRRTSLCGSFTSSGSLSGWSSAGSQFLGSDEETPEASQGSDLMEWKSRTEIHTKSPVMLRRFLNDQSTPAEITSTPQRRDDPDEASASRSLASYQVDYQASDGLTFPRINDKRVTPSLTSSGTLKRQKEFYLSSLPTSQPPTEISTENDRVLSSQVPLSSQIPTFRRLSQFRGSSQASQPKKKSRMGF